MRCLLAAFLAVFVALAIVPTGAQVPAAPAAPDDRERAQTLMAEAGGLLAQRTSGSLNDSIARYEQALGIWQALGETSRQVETLIDLATARFLLHQPDASASLLAQGGEVARTSGNRADEAAALVAMASLHTATGELHKALEETVGAGGIFHSLGSQDAEAQMLQMQGRLHTGLQDPPAAIAAYTQSLALFRATKDRKGEALALLGAGQAYNLLNTPQGFEQAAAYLGEAAPLFDALSDKFNLSYTLWGLATANDRLGRKEQARDAYVRALPLFVERGDTIGRARILLSLGEDEQALRNFNDARGYFEQALPLLVSPGEELSHGLALMGLGKARESLGDEAGALEAYGDALPVWRSINDPALEAAAELKIGALQFAARAWQAALDAYAAALKLSEAAGDAPGQATALIAIAGVHERRGDYRQTLEAASRALPLLDGDPFAKQRSLALLMAGDAANALHQNTKALFYLDQVIALGQENPAGKAAALASEGEIYTGRRDPKKGLELQGQALAMDQAMQDAGAANKVRGDIGLTYLAMGRKAEALDAFEASLASARSGGDLQQQAATLNNLAQVHQGFGDTGEAVALYQQALAAVQQSGDRDVEASTLANLGMAYHQLGDDARAFETLDRALAIRREFGDRHSEAITLNNLALVYNDTGEPQKALNTYGEVKAAFGSLEDRPNEAATLSNIGSVYRGLGATDRARTYFQQALAIQEQIEDDDGRAATLNNLAVLAHSEGEQREARRLYEQSLALAQKLGNRPAQARLRSGMGIVNDQLDHPDRAIEQLTQSLAIAQETGNPNAEALALHNLGTVYERMGEPQQALDYLERALVLWRQIRSAEGETIGLFVIARIEAAQGSLDAALSHVDDSMRVSESLRSRVGNEDLRASLLARSIDAYGLKIELLMRLDALHPGQGYDAQAFKTSERARARSLLDLLSESHANIRQGVDPELLNREKAIESALSAKAVQQAKLAANGPPGPEFTDLDHEIEDLISAHDKVMAEIRAASPSYAALTQPEPLSLQQVQRLLDPDTLLLEYSLAGEHSYVWVVTSVALHTYQLPRREIVEAAARDLQRVLPDVANPQSLDAASAKLGTMLLGPVAAQLGTKRLVVVSDPVLQAAVPFALLADPNAPKGRPRPLIVDHEIVQEPSASVVVALRQGAAGRVPPAGIVAVLADPVFSANDPRLVSDSKGSAADTSSVVGESTRSVTGNNELERLPYTRVEARSILALAAPGRSFSRFGFDATKEVAENPQLASYRIVHFATHGLLNQRNPGLSGLVFSQIRPDGTPEDGYLRLNDVFNLTLPVALVVLSACDSAQGKLVGGEGLVGLTNGFLYAGAASLTVSLWNVNDRATAALMAGFYREMLQRDHRRPAAALRLAQLGMIRDRRWGHPWYWAPFIIEGEWR
jgi:CHAT domain-containing protein/Tfp pilus assembly protein PilF